MSWENAISAFMAFVITFGTAVSALLVMPGVDGPEDITMASWIVLTFGSIGTWWKDNQALFVRRAVSAHLLKTPTAYPKYRYPAAYDHVTPEEETTK